MGFSKCISSVVSKICKKRKYICCDLAIKDEKKSLNKLKRLRCIEGA